MDAVRGVVLEQRRTHRNRSCGAGGRPQRARHLRDALQARRLHRSQAVFDRLAHRASAIADRPLPAIGRNAGNPLLGAADYKLVHHASNGRSVYSFCMCPGGTVVAATSEPGRVVTNGMSQYSRNERNANSGIVVGITPEQDYPGDPLAGMEFQRHWESRAFELGGKNYCAPGQLVGDFLAGSPSAKFGEVQPSYTARRAPDRSATACRITRSPRSARRCPRSPSRSRDSPWPMRC